LDSFHMYVLGPVLYPQKLNKRAGRDLPPAFKNANANPNKPKRTVPKTNTIKGAVKYKKKAKDPGIAKYTNCLNVKGPITFGSCSMNCGT
ncbi:MAG: hypothetical protein Q7R48_02485, partial [bacterium]|nr:hypothetical protein [bacterium]